MLEAVGFDAWILANGRLQLERNLSIIRDLRWKVEDQNLSFRFLCLVIINSNSTEFKDQIDMRFMRLELVEIEFFSDKRDLR